MKNTLIRLLVCLMMATLLLPCAAIAESAEVVVEEVVDEATEDVQIETVEWIDENGLITISLPADWIEFNGELIAQLVRDMLDAGMLDEAGANEYTKELMTQVESVYAFFYAADMVGNMNITVADTQGTDMVAAFEILKTSYEAQYAQMGATVNSFDLTNYAGRNAIIATITYLGVDQTQVLLQPDDFSVLFTFTFAGSAQDCVDLVMNSVVLPE